MEPDPALVEFTQEWLMLAKGDLDSAQHALVASPPFVNDALFHCQQGAEKAMKALLTYHDSPFPKTHDLEDLGKLCKAVDGTLGPAVKTVEPLTAYATQLRYPGARLEPTLQQAKESIQLARAFFDAIIERIPPLANC